MVRQSAGILDIMAWAAALSIVSDYLQYFFGAKSVQFALDHRRDQLYDDTRYDFHLRRFFFRAKQFLTFVSVVMLLIAMSQTL